MKTMKMSSALKAIKEGRMECVTDLKLGYVTVRVAKKNGGSIGKTLEIVKG
jgi:hypothetical protein